jgi:elongation factor Tu
MSLKFIVFFTGLLVAVSGLTQPLIIPVRDAYPMPGMGWMVSGNIESGTLREGTRVEVRGTTEKVYNLEVKRIFTEGRQVEVAEKWKEVQLLLSGDGDDQVRRGMLIGDPGYFKTAFLVKAKIKMSVAKNAVPIIVNEPLSVQVMRYTEMMEFAWLLTDQKLLNPGDEVEVTIKYSRPSAVAKDEPFNLIHNGKIIATGKFREVVNNLKPEHK